MAYRSDISLVCLMLYRADNALCKAKNGGRNRIVFYDNNHNLVYNFLKERCTGGDKKSVCKSGGGRV
jgi:hypothetical protein